MHHVLELGLGGGEQFLGRLDVPVHRAADVEDGSTFTVLCRSGRIRMSR